ncbi:hypothetical protein HanPI659440_Chr07g0276841 [Helianthus annuus]|nr:hypothetical protein HanPI659440_Chr07g0276841 [Helianthus annuus]
MSMMRLQLHMMQQDIHHGNIHLQTYKKGYIFYSLDVIFKLINISYNFTSCVKNLNNSLFVFLTNYIGLL